METYDFNLLKALYKVHSPSGREKKMRKFLKRWCNNIGANVEVDKSGNVLVTKGVAVTYPCVAAHIDQVQEQHSKDFKVYQQGDVIFAYSAKSMSQQGLGADDKNGIWIALHLLAEFDVIKCAFFVGEEVGCVGSSAVDMDFFSDVRFVIQADRRNGSDLITDISGSLCSDEFLRDINYKKFGYKETSGLMTDVEELCSRDVGVSCINFSCGYYKPHTDDECTKWSELCNALDFARYIVGHCTRVYPHKYESKWNKYDWGKFGYGYGYGTWGKSGMKTKSSSYHWDKNKNEYIWGDDDDDDVLSGSTWDSDKDSSGEIVTDKTASSYKHATDKETMRYILEDEPWLSFDEMMDNYPSWFILDDIDELQQVYDECVSEMTQVGETRNYYDF